ncbi:MAG: exodeoxyribonuclease VII small subunit [Christensenellales bacterium]|jgi:exonuclease VII small subunit|nr:exodeoxyribonuclease VII small subunit [Clostridiales bacterium]MBS6942665.1 exodeoxyribonuclease VII small subunit [Clostridiales bacterium]
MPAKQQLTLEQAMTELEAMAQEMETPGLSIDKMMEYYEKSNELAAFCQEKLNGYRARIAKIQEGKEIEIEA